jgi:hypothetical protein
MLLIWIGKYLLIIRASSALAQVRRISFRLNAKCLWTGYCCFNKVKFLRDWTGLSRCMVGRLSHGFPLGVVIEAGS